MSSRTRRAAAVKAAGCLLEREEGEIYRGGEQWENDWRSEAAAEEPEAAPTAKRQKARAPQRDGTVVQRDDRQQERAQPREHAETQQDVQSAVAETAPLAGQLAQP